MAIVAKRSSRSKSRQVGALPWRIIDGDRQVMMITSRETRRWVIPKGGRMAGKTDAEAAAIEAMEEAGVQGDIGSDPLGAFRYAKRLRSGGDRMYVVAVYPLRVLIQLGDWPEAAERERRWMSLDDAAASVDEPDLARLILDFAHAPLED